MEDNMLYKEFLKSLVGKKGILHSRRECASIFVFCVTDLPRHEYQIEEVHDDFVIIDTVTSIRSCKQAIPISLLVVEY
jgi:hypothetical protein